MRLTTSPEEARKLVLSIPHKTCASAVTEHWQVEPDGKVRAQSVLWLFCWAKTGMNSENARVVSVDVFDKIMPVSFKRFDAVIDHEYARRGRYSSGDMELEVEELLAKAEGAGHTTGAGSAV